MRWCLSRNPRTSWPTSDSRIAPQPPRKTYIKLKSLFLRGQLTTNSIPIYSGPRRDKPIGINHRIIDPHHLAIQGGGIDTVAILAAGGAGRMTTAPKTQAKEWLAAMETAANA
jgi:hypothetical protein